MKQQLLLLFLLLPFIIHAQDVERIVIEGQISAPANSDIEGVAIYNNSANRGTVTDSEGAFELAVALNDVIVVSAIQYATFKVIVDQKVIDNKKLGIYLNPVVNELSEVTVRQYDLTGNLVVDVENIKTVDLDTEWDLSYETLEFDYEFAPDRWSSLPGNYAESVFYNNQEQYGLNLMGGLGLLAQLVWKERASKTFMLKPRRPDKTGVTLRERYTKEVIHNSFNIPEGKENDFLYFVEDNGVADTLLAPEKELQLLAVLEQQAKAYLKQINE